MKSKKQAREQLVLDIRELINTKYKDINNLNNKRHIITAIFDYMEEDQFYEFDILDVLFNHTILTKSFTNWSGNILVWLSEFIHKISKL